MIVNDLYEELLMTVPTLGGVTLLDILRAQNDCKQRRIRLLEKAIRDSFESGYSQGRNDTAESRIRIYSDAADDYLKEAKL